MFDNAGKQIKGIAIGFFITQIVVGILAAVTLFVISALADEDAVWIGCLLGGLFTLVAIPFAAWFSALILYGFGEIVDTAIVNRQEEKVKYVAPPAPKPQMAPTKTKAPAIKTVSSAPKARTSCKPHLDQYIGKNWCCACGEILSQDEKECQCGSVYFVTITEENVEKLLSDTLASAVEEKPESIPICKCGAIPNRVGNEYICPECCRRFR